MKQGNLRSETAIIEIRMKSSLIRHSMLEAQSNTLNEYKVNSLHSVAVPVAFYVRFALLRMKGRTRLHRCNYGVGLESVHPE
jgi:hypothetical protein